MRAVIQLVSEASVAVDNIVIGAINSGLVILLGVAQQDTEHDARQLAEKIINLRIFPDEKQLMNLSLLDVEGELLAISQFTLFADCRKGRRPSYTKAAAPELANSLYQLFIAEVRKAGITVATGKFQATMRVALTNQGPITILLDSEKIF